MTVDLNSQVDEKAIYDKLDVFLRKNLNEFKNGSKPPTTSGLEKSVVDFENEFSTFCEKDLSESSVKSKALYKAEDEWKYGKADPGHISSMENYGGKEENSEWAVFNYYYMRLIYAKWSTISKTFPNSKTLLDAAKRSENVYKKMGSKEEAEKGAEIAKADHLAKVKMDPATASDPELEAQIKKALGKTTFGEGRTVVKVNLHNKDWNIKRNALTSVILSRSKNFSAVVKEKDGSCTLIRYTSYKQDYIGSSYGNGYVYMGQADKIPCENVNK